MAEAFTPPTPARYPAHGFRGQAHAAAAELRWRVGLYLHLVGARIRSQLQYRVSFALDLIGAFFITFIDFLAVIIIFSHLPRLSGWTLAEIGFFYGAANISFAFADMIVGHLDMFSQMIRTGSFDMVLIRPIGSLFQVISSDLALRRLGRVAQAVVVLLFAISRLHIPWDVGRVGMLLLMIVTGTVIYCSIWVIGTSIAFWTTEVRELTNAFTYGGSFVGSYPINIFGGWTRRLLAFVVPIGFVSYFPGLYILNRHDPIAAPYFLRFCTPLVALLIALLARQVWQTGVRQYRSTGS